MPVHRQEYNNKEKKKKKRFICFFVSRALAFAHNNFKIYDYYMWCVSYCNSSIFSYFFRNEKNFCHSNGELVTLKYLLSYTDKIEKEEQVFLRTSLWLNRLFETDPLALLISSTEG